MIVPRPAAHAAGLFFFSRFILKINGREYQDLPIRPSRLFLLAFIYVFRFLNSECFSELSHRDIIFPGGRFLFFGHRFRFRNKFGHPGFLRKSRQIAGHIHHDSVPAVR